MCGPVVRWGEGSVTFELVGPGGVPEFERLRAACYARRGVRLDPPQLADPGVRRLVAVGRAGWIAGIRLHPRDARHPLPLEAVVGEHPVVRAEVARRTGEGVAELTGLWSGEGVGGTGIGAVTIRAGVALARSLGLRHLVSLAHEGTRFARAIGFVPDERIGWMPYPDPRYRSAVHWCDTGEAR